MIGRGEGLANAEAVPDCLEDVGCELRASVAADGLEGAVVLGDVHEEQLGGFLGGGRLRARNKDDTLGEFVHDDKWRRICRDRGRAGR